MTRHKRYRFILNTHAALYNYIENDSNRVARK